MTLLVRRRSLRRGTTLIELIVTLVLLALFTSLAGLTVARFCDKQKTSTWLDTVAGARDSALRVGRPLTVEISLEGKAIPVTTMPDGRIISQPSLPVDMLTGRSARENP